MEDKVVERIIDVFADDLFQYVFPRRINIFYYRNPENKSEGLPTVFHPYIGMSVLCESQRRQKDFLTWFGAYYPSFATNRRSFMTFCSNIAVHLWEENKDNVIQASISIASMVLELCVFCHLRGHKNFKYFAGICWAEVFKYFLAQDFFPNHDWTDFKKFSEEDAKTYIKGQYEVVLDQNRVEFRTDWLREYDYWVTIFDTERNESPIEEQPSETTDELSAPSDESHLPDTSFNTEDKGCENEEDVFDSNQESGQLDGGEIKMKIKLKPASVVQKVDAELFVKFKRIIYEGHYSRELFKILESEQEMNTLMYNTVFLQVVTEMVENTEERMENENVLELVKMLLMGNEDLAMFFVKATRFIMLTNTIGSMKSGILNSGEYYPESRSQNSTAAQQNKTSNSETSNEVPKPRRKLGAIPKRTRSGIDKASNRGYVKLLGDFKRAISASYDLEGVEICEILESKDYVYFLLDNHVFRSMMELTVKFPVKRRWGNRWILSFVKSLINASRTLPPPTSEKSSQVADDLTDASDHGISRKDNSAQTEITACLTPTAKTTSIAKVTQLDKLSDIQNSPNSCSGSSLPDPNAVLYPFSSEDSGASEDMKAVYVDIVNLSSSVKKLLVDVLKEEDSHKLSEGHSEETPGSLEDLQKKSKSKKKNRKRKNRRRNKGSESKSAPSSLSDTVNADNPPEVEETYDESGPESNSDDSDNDKNFLHNLGQRMARLGIDTTPRKNVEPISIKQSTTPNLQKKGKYYSCAEYEELAKESSVSVLMRVIGKFDATPKKATGEATNVSEQPSALPSTSRSSMSDFTKILNLMPTASSNIIFDFLLQQVMATNPKFLETLKEKKCINEAQMNELMKRCNRNLLPTEDTEIAHSSHAEHDDSLNPPVTQPQPEKSNDPGAPDKNASPCVSPSEGKSSNIPDTVEDANDLML